jgi:hypothetical protein
MAPAAPENRAAPITVLMLDWFLNAGWVLAAGFSLERPAEFSQWTVAAPNAAPEGFQIAK